MIDQETLEMFQRADALATRKSRPYLWYEPHAKGQQQFHAAPQRIRALFPGNRFGKTTAEAIEVQDQVDRKERSVILWICPQYRTFELLRPQLEEEVFGPVPYNGADNHYYWPNRSLMYVIPRERDWSFVQSINPDLVCIDEECPLPLWRELRARGAGRNETRYIIAATATNMAGSWMEGEIYQVWLDYHAALGLSEAEAMVQQRHPEIFCWPRGGIADNPGMTPAKVAYFRGLSWSSDKEKKVRDEGGFERMTGDAVFPFAALEALRARRKADAALTGSGELGILEREGQPSTDINALQVTDLVGKRFKFVPLPARGGNRIQFWEPPLADHLYVIGADFAYGIEGRDWDAAVILDATAMLRTGEAVQVGELQGHWGETFDTILYAAIRYWGDAFLLGERQVGLFTLKRLWKQYGVRYMYYQRDLQTGGEQAENDPALGWHRSGNDLAMREFRMAVQKKSLLLRSEALIDQMSKLQWRNPREEGGADREGDERLKMKLQGGGSPDLVMAACYANYALQCVFQYEKPKPVFAEGTYGALFGLDKALPGLFGSPQAAKWVPIA